MRYCEANNFDGLRYASPNKNLLGCTESVRCSSFVMKLLIIRTVEVLAYQTEELGGVDG